MRSSPAPICNLSPESGHNHKLHLAAQYEKEIRRFLLQTMGGVLICTISITSTTTRAQRLPDTTVQRWSRLPVTFLSCKKVCYNRDQHQYSRDSYPGLHYVPGLLKLVRSHGLTLRNNNNAPSQ
eukprot:1696026-Rhodomonas_salina.1